MAGAVRTSSSIATPSAAAAACQGASSGTVGRVPQRAADTGTLGWVKRRTWSGFESGWHGTLRTTARRATGIVVTAIATTTAAVAVGIVTIARIVTTTGRRADARPVKGRKTRRADSIASTTTISKAATAAKRRDGDPVSSLR